MAEYEVQANTQGGWQIVAVFDTYELAFDCAIRLDRDRIYDDLRVTREILNPQTGRYRATTLYKCGQKIRDEISRELEEAEKLAAMKKRQIRLNKQLLPRWSRRKTRDSVREQSQTHPIHILFWTTVLFFTGMAAIYYIEFFLLDR